MIRVVVTGASGFVGSHCLSPLLDAGVDVVSLGRTAPDIDRVAHIECDLLDDETRSTLIPSIGASHLLHLAWNLEPGVYNESGSNLDWLAASLRLVREFGLAGGRRVIVTGSCFEYEWGPSVLSEDSPIAPNTLYGLAKGLLHQALDGYSHRDGPDLAWPRLFFLYGPGENTRRLAGAVTSSLLRGESVDTSEGVQRRDYMYIEDAGRALAALTLSDVTGPVNIARGTAIPVRALIGALADAIGKPDLVAYGARETPAGEAPVVEADIHRLLSEVGFDQFTELESGAASTVAWWRARLGVS